MSAKYFEDLEVWKLSRNLTNTIYSISNDGRFAKDYGLRDQIRRAAVSIMSNIAEGYERGGNKEFIQFMSISKASCGEVRSQLYVAMDQNYVGKTKCVQLTGIITPVINPRFTRTQILMFCHSTMVFLFRPKYQSIPS